MSSASFRYCQSSTYFQEEADEPVPLVAVHGGFGQVEELGEDQEELMELAVEDARR